MGTKTMLCLTLLACCLAACGSGAEADLEKSSEELQKQADEMSKAELEQAIEDLEELAEELGEEGKATEMKDLNSEKVQEFAERGLKIAKVISIYQMELASRK